MIVTTEIKFFRSRDVQLPERGTEESAGLDFYTPKDLEPFVLNPNESKTIPSGIYTKFSSGLVLLGCNRGSVGAKRKLVLGAHVVDSDYQGEIFIDIHNIGTEPQTISPDEKIAQFLLLPYYVGIIKEADSLDALYNGHTTDRGTGALGSTNKK